MQTCLKSGLRVIWQVLAPVKVILDCQSWYPFCSLETHAYFSAPQRAARAAIDLSDSNARAVYIRPDYCTVDSLITYTPSGTFYDPSIVPHGIAVTDYHKCSYVLVEYH